MPINYADYHPEWASIRRQILDQAEHRCEFCGVANYAVGARDRQGVWHDEDEIEGMNSGMGERLFGDYPDMIRIVLTIAHLDHDVANNDPCNLRALCNRCHLNWDREHHRANAAVTLRRKRQEAIAATGQQTFLAATP